MLDTLVLKQCYPCHKANGVRLAFITLVPRQWFERKCPACGLKWGIMVTQLKYNRKWVSIHKSDWEVIQ